MFIIKLRYLTYMFLDAHLDLLLRFTGVEAITIISITQNFVHASGSSAQELLAAVEALSIDFILPWAVARMRTEVCINKSPKNGLSEIP
jgi:hypothetical protein